MSQKTILVLVCALALIVTGAQLMAQNPVGQAASQAGSAASQAGKDAASQTGNAASQAADAASQTGKDAASQAGDAASQAGNAASETADKAADAGRGADPSTKAKVEAKLQQISSELNLTDEQKTQIKPVLQDEFTQLRGVKNDTSMSSEQKKAKASEIHESAKSQISSFLTPEQQKKLADMRDTARDK